MMLNMNETLGNIFGMRLLDDQGEKIMEAIWFTPATDVVTAWKTSVVPAGREVIGVHGTHDGDYMTNLGLIVWRPNPDAKKILQ